MEERRKGKKIIGMLYEALGEVTYQSWFHTNEFIPLGLKKGKPSFDIKTNFARDHINSLHADIVQKAFESSYGLETLN